VLKSFKRLCRLALERSPYRLHKWLPGSRLSAARLGLMMARSIVPQDRPVRLVQVGACDGILDDPLDGCFGRDDITALLVEPAPAAFAELETLYRDRRNVQTVRCAIAAADGNMKLFVVKNDGRWKGDTRTKLWASLNRRHLLRMGVLEQEIESIDIPTMTLGSLYEHMDWKGTDFLFVDTEGSDAVVVRQALGMTPPPAVIVFENVHLFYGDTQSLSQELDTRGYLWIHDGMNSLCVHDQR
jgi:FkbM family methyltransferase